MAVGIKGWPEFNASELLAVGASAAERPDLHRLVDELDSGRLQCAANGQVVGRGLEISLSVSSARRTKGGFSGEVLGAPAKECTGGSDLRTGQPAY